MELEQLLSHKAFMPFRETISARSAEQLILVYKMCEEKKWNFHNLKPLLSKMIEYDVPEVWTDRITLSKEKYKNDSASLGSFQNRYGDIIGKQMWIEKTAKTTVSRQKYVQKHGEQAWENLCASKASIDEKSFIRRYGEEEGIRRRQEYLTKWTSSVKSKDGWDNGLSLESFIARHGEEKGYEMWNARRENQRKRFSKEWFQEEHGAGWEAEWDSYCSHMADLSLKGSLKKRKGTNGKTYSKKSQKLFESLAKNKLVDCLSVKFATNGGEMTFRFPRYKELGGGHWFSVDFIMGRKIIEFDGTYWHALSKIAEKDAIKDKVLQENGYQILRISEVEYDRNPLETIKKCIDFLNEEKEIK